MRRCFRPPQSLLSRLMYWAILSPRLQNKEQNNSSLFVDDKSGASVTNHPSFSDVTCRQIHFPTVDGTLLNSWLFTHQNSDMLLLFNIGRSGDIQEKLRHVRLLLNAGVSVFVYEYRGFGASSGTPSPASICEDGLSAYDFVRDCLGYDGEHIVIFGESLGAAVAAHTSSQRPSRALIMQSGFISLRAIARQVIKTYAHLPEFLCPIPKWVLNNLQIVSRPHPQLLIIHGELDPLIPVSEAHTLFDGALEKKQLVILPTSKHSDLGMSEADIPLFESTVTEFLKGL